MWNTIPDSNMRQATNLNMNRKMPAPNNTMKRNDKPKTNNTVFIIINFVPERETNP
jgi:hypothetical protein